MLKFVSINQGNAVVICISHERVITKRKIVGEIVTYPLQRNNFQGQTL